MEQIWITDWMMHIGWRRLDDGSWHKVAPSGLIVAVSGDSTWVADCEWAGDLERQLQGTRVQ